MRLGGNQGWRSFFEQHDDTKMRGLSWDDATIAERYSSEVGEEWKERLSAKVEGREYVPGERKSSTPQPTASAAKPPPKQASRAGTPLQGVATSGSRTASPNRPGVKARVDDKYFARLGEENASRSEDLPPSQGGKYGGFGNTPMPAKNGSGGALPDLADVQKDPVAALTKGFGWFTTTVSKTAKGFNDEFIQPTAKQISESDFAAQARMAAGNVGKAAQAGAMTAQERFNRFVEGSDGHGQRQAPIDESKKSFWDDFSAVADQRHGTGPKYSSVGTSAMGRGANKNAPASAKKDDEWDDW